MAVRCRRMSGQSSEESWRRRVDTHICRSTCMPIFANTEASSAHKRRSMASQERRRLSKQETDSGGVFSSRLLVTKCDCYKIEKLRPTDMVRPTWYDRCGSSAWVHK